MLDEVKKIMSMTNKDLFEYRSKIDKPFILRRLATVIIANDYKEVMLIIRVINNIYEENNYG